jgi:hypothetical protein
MIQINKGPEPRKWAEKRKTPGVTVYESIPELKDALLKEQGYICAFCMRRIPVKDKGETETSKNAHLLSRQNHPDQQLDFQNMVASCPGYFGEIAHCDKSQGSNDVTLPMFGPQLQISIRFGSYTGEIKSTNESWNREIQGLLNLNNPRLMTSRAQVLNGVRIVLEGKKWKKAKLQEILQQWKNLDGKGERKAYCGIVIWYLEKKLRQK